MTVWLFGVCSGDLLPSDLQKHFVKMFHYWVFFQLKLIQKLLRLQENMEYLIIMFLKPADKHDLLSLEVLRSEAEVTKRLRTPAVDGALRATSGRKKMQPSLSIS